MKEVRFSDDSRTFRSVAVPPINSPTWKTGKEALNDGRMVLYEVTIHDACMLMMPACS